MEELKEIISKEGLKVSGMGMLANNTKKMIEVLDKIQKFLYFMEKRQTVMEEHLKKITEKLK
jgi:hypothetical protein